MEIHSLRGAIKVTRHIKIDNSTSHLQQRWGGTIPRTEASEKYKTEVEIRSIAGCARVRVFLI